MTTNILQYPSIGEKSVALVDKENKIVFIVDERANKEDVRKAVESQFKVKVDKINILRDRKNRKKAFVKLSKEFKAEEIATTLGLI